MEYDINHHSFNTKTVITMIDRISAVALRHRLYSDLLTAAIVATFFMFVQAPAHANPITFDLIGASVNLGAGTESITGSFTVDPTTNIESDVSITLSGTSEFAGSYAQGAATSEIPSQIRAGRDVFIVTQEIVLGFFNLFSSAPDRLTAVAWFDSVGDLAGGEDVTGEAVPALEIPEPGSLALLTGAFCCFLFARQAKRGDRTAPARRRRTA